jgi:hypothetical protein
MKEEKKSEIDIKYPVIDYIDVFLDKKYLIKIVTSSYISLYMISQLNIPDGRVGNRHLITRSGGSGTVKT